MKGLQNVAGSADFVADASTSKLRCAGVELASSDPENLARFYVDVLTFAHVNATARHIELKLVDCGRKMPTHSRSHGRWFRHLAIVVRDIAQARAYVEKFSPLTVSARTETLPAWNEASAGIEALPHAFLQMGGRMPATRTIFGDIGLVIAGVRARS